MDEKNTSTVVSLKPSHVSTEIAMTSSNVWSNHSMLRTQGKFNCIILIFKWFQLNFALKKIAKHNLMRSPPVIHCFAILLQLLQVLHI